MNVFFQNKPTPTVTKQELLKTKECYMLGRLALEEENFPGGETNEPVTLMKNGSAVMFFVKPLTEEPEPIRNYYKRLLSGNLYIGLDNTQPNAIFNDLQYNSMSLERRITTVKEKLSHKLLLFKPEINYPNKKDGQPFLNLELVSVEGDIDGTTMEHFVTIPKTNMSVERFEYALATEKVITLPHYSHCYKSPKFIICDEYIYYNFEKLSRVTMSGTDGWKLTQPIEEISKVKIEESFFDHYVVSGTEYLVFISEEGEFYLDQSLTKEGVSLSPTIKKLTTTSTPNVRVQPLSLPKMKISPCCEDELKFLQQLQYMALKENLNYSMKDLINFHVSVKTNALTMVAGLSGMGKTQLSRLYARVLGLSETTGDFLFLPIRPSYTDVEDVLGFLNPTTNCYVPSTTGLVDLLVEAEKNPNRLFMVAFDEMNLSQIEYWFAPFLSLLELKAEERRLFLYKDAETCYNKKDYPASIQIGDNVIFVGTANLDETTKEFSDRLLDRVNLVTLTKETFTSFKTNVEVMNSWGVDENKTYTYEQFKGWLKTSTTMIESFTTEELEFFDELHAVINRYDSQKGVSYRLLNKIGSYINNLPSAEVNGVRMTRSEAIDLGLKQRLLTKIKGQQRQIGELVGVTYALNDDMSIEGELFNLFQSSQAQAISSFEETLKEIKRKALELGIYGQTN